jgi:hypothetical protein
MVWQHAFNTFPTKKVFSLSILFLALPTEMIILWLFNQTPVLKRMIEIASTDACNEEEINHIRA